MSYEPETQPHGHLVPPPRVPPTAVGTMTAPPPRGRPFQVTRVYFGVKRPLILALTAIAIEGAVVALETRVWWSRAAGVSALLFAGTLLAIAAAELIARRRAS